MLGLCKFLAFYVHSQQCRVPIKLIHMYIWNNGRTAGTNLIMEDLTAIHLDQTILTTTFTCVPVCISSAAHQTFISKNISWNRNCTEMTHYVHNTFSVKDYGFQEKSNITHTFLNFYTYRELFMPLPTPLVCEHSFIRDHGRIICMMAANYCLWKQKENIYFTNAHCQILSYIH
jgi:hypothetical protein